MLAAGFVTAAGAAAMVIASQSGGAALEADSSSSAAAPGAAPPAGAGPADGPGGTSASRDAPAPSSPAPSSPAPSAPAPSSPAPSALAPSSPAPSAAVDDLGRARALTEERLGAVLAAFERWSSVNEGAPCPPLAALDPSFDLAGGGAAARDGWGNALRLTCTEQPRAHQAGAISAGPDGELGSADDVASWKVPRLAAAAPKGPRWGARPESPKAPPSGSSRRPSLPDLSSKPARPGSAAKPSKPAIIDKDGDGIPDVR
jgi:hypothetical protein